MKTSSLLGERKCSRSVVKEDGDRHCSNCQSHRKERPTVLTWNMTKEFPLFPRNEHGVCLPQAALVLCRGLPLCHLSERQGTQSRQWSLNLLFALSLSFCPLLSPLPSLFYVIFATFAVLTCQLQTNYYVTMAGSYRRNLASLNQRWLQFFLSVNVLVE